MPNTAKPVLDLTRSKDKTHALAWIAAARRGAIDAGWPKDKTEALILDLIDGSYEELLARCKREFEIRA